MNQDTSKWEPNKHLATLSVVIFIYNVLAFILTLIFNQTFVNYNNPPIRVALTALVLSWNHLHAISALVEFFLKRNQQIRLLNLFETLDNLIEQNLNAHADYAKLRKTCRRIIIVWMFEVLSFLVAVCFFFIETGNERLILFMLSFVPSYMICKLSYAYSISLVCLIEENINVLSKYLKSVTKPNGYYISEAFLHEPRSKKTNYPRTSQVNLQPSIIFFMKNVYSILWEVSAKVKSLFSWSLAIGLSNEMFVLIFNSYWMVLNIFFRSRALSSYIIPTTFILTGLINLLCITYHHRKAVETVSHQGEKFYSLEIVYFTRLM